IDLHAARQEAEGHVVADPHARTAPVAAVQADRSLRVEGCRHHRREAAIGAHAPAPGGHRAAGRRRCRKGGDLGSTLEPFTPMLATLTHDVPSGPELVFAEK